MDMGPSTPGSVELGPLGQDDDEDDYGQGDNDVAAPQSNGQGVCVCIEIPDGCQPGDPVMIKTYAMGDDPGDGEGTSVPFGDAIETAIKTWQKQCGAQPDDGQDDSDMQAGYNDPYGSSQGMKAAKGGGMMSQTVGGQPDNAT